MQNTSNFIRHFGLGTDADISVSTFWESAAQVEHSLHYVVLELPVRRLWKTIGRIKTYFKNAAQTYVFDLYIGQRVQLPGRAR